MANKTIGILGGGQLGRMLALAGIPLGLRFRVLNPIPNAPASHVAEQIVGNYNDPAALRSFATDLDVITYEFENIPVGAVRFLAQSCQVYPSPEALETAQDRLAEKQFFVDLGIPTSTFASIDNRFDLDAAQDYFGLPALLKTRRMGYDGKGQVVLREPSDVDHAWATIGGVPLILESLVPFERELSIIAVRGRDGSKAFYPLIENTHQNGILRFSRAPVPQITPDLQAQAESYATRIMDRLNYVGVLTIELFQFSGTLLANEMAPRVHNSGHWTIEGAETSQFANHLRAILGLPLGSTEAKGYNAMINIIGTNPPDAAKVLAVAGAHLHLYDKIPRAGRKLGHITVHANDPQSLARAVREL